MKQLTTNKRGGFTILEVILGMGILLIGMTAIIGLMTFGAALAHAAQMRTAAANVAEAIVADLDESLFPLEEDGSVGEPTEFENRPLPGFEGVTYSIETRVNPEHSDEYRVDVQMNWESGGVLRSQEFSTLMTREVPFGERMRSGYSPSR